MHKVKLRFFEDDATGDYGLAHDNAIDTNAPFNAFWNALGIFHDVFEHWHEETKYFKDQYAFNVGGEVAAMGAMYYFVNDMDFQRRAYIRDVYIGNSRNIIGTTNSEIIDAVKYGYTRYGDTFECNVPYQRMDSDEAMYLDEMAQEQYAEIVKARKEMNADEESIESAIEYGKSVRLWKLKRLYRWGFIQARKLVPERWNNRKTLNDFWQDMERLTKYSAKELAGRFRGITVTITKDKEGDIKYKVRLERVDGTTTSLSKFFEDEYVDFE